MPSFLKLIYDQTKRNYITASSTIGFIVPPYILPLFLLYSYKTSHHWQILGDGAGKEESS